jgi:hypothetical protein
VTANKCACRLLRMAISSGMSTTAQDRWAVLFQGPYVWGLLFDRQKVQGRWSGWFFLCIGVWFSSSILIHQLLCKRTHSREDDEYGYE